jgi:hypothetical protein
MLFQRRRKIMEKVLLKIPFCIKMKCLNCRRKVKINLQDIPPEDELKFRCVHCGRINDLSKDKDIQLLAETFSKHRGEILDFINRGIAKLAVKLIYQSGNPLELNPTLIKLLKLFPKRDLEDLLLEFVFKKPAP